MVTYLFYYICTISDTLENTIYLKNINAEEAREMVCVRQQLILEMISNEVVTVFYRNAQYRGMRYIAEMLC